MRKILTVIAALLAIVLFAQPSEATHGFFRQRVRVQRVVVQQVVAVPVRRAVVQQVIAQPVYQQQIVAPVYSQQFVQPACSAFFVR